MTQAQDLATAIEKALGTQNDPNSRKVWLEFSEALINFLGNVQVSQSLSGDVTGTTAASIVSKLQGSVLLSPVSSGSSNKLLHGDNSGSLNWSKIDLANDVTGTLAIGNQASQSMSGDVSGTTAASTVDKLKGKSLDSSLSSIGASQDGYVLEWSNGSSFWTASKLPTSLPPSGSAGGDLSGTYPNPTVAKINGNAVTAQTLGASTDGYALTWSNSDGYYKAKSINTSISTLYNGTTAELTVSSGTTTTSNLPIEIKDNADGYIATVGDLRLPDVAVIKGRKHNNSADVSIMSMDTSDVITFGDSSNSSSSKLVASTSVLLNIGANTVFSMSSSSIIGAQPISVGLTTKNNTLIGGLIGQVNSIVGDISVPDGYCIIDVDTTSTAISITLPTPTSGRLLIVRDSTGKFSTNNCTIIRNGSEKINNIAASKVLSAAFGLYTITCDGTNWLIM